MMPLGEKDAFANSGMANGKEPRWVHPFLRALERTGDVRASAEDAGIDHSTAYARRRAHAAFAADWERALSAHAAGVERERAEELEALARGLRSPGSPLANPASPAGGRGELVGSGSQMKRAGHDRWGPRKEKAFFDELAATANVKHAAKAAGVSPNAVYARRIRDAHFRAKWAAVLESGKASIEMHLVEAANRTFDPEDLDTGEVMPKVSVAEAIKISQQAQAARGRGVAMPDPYEEDGPSYEDEIADIRERLVKKLQALRRRDRPDQIARGWSYDESWDVDIPPGWVKGPDWRPMQPGDEG